MYQFTLLSHHKSGSRLFTTPHSFELKKTRKKFLNTITLMLCLATFFTATVTGCKTKTAESQSQQGIQADKDSILATIEKETASFFARDYEAWKSTYAHADYAFQAWSNRDGTFDASVGWNKIDNTVGKYIHDNPEPQSSSHPDVERKNIMYKFYGPNACYLTWDQFNSNKQGDNFHHSKEVRVMEKINGQWKIVCVAAFWDYQNPIAADKLKDIQRMDKESRGTDKI